MTSIEQMRVDISRVYPSTTWENKVKRMPDAQVVAIYNKMSQNGQIKKARPLRVRTDGVQLKMEGVDI